MIERRTAARAISVFFLSTSLLLAAKAAERPAAPADWQARVQQQIAEAEYAVSCQERPLVPTVGPAWQAPNRAQAFRTYFTDGGPVVIPRTEDVPSWRWGLRVW
jgi:hypothetical protein